MRSCMNLKEELTRQNIKHDWLIGTNESLVTRARNEMTATFLHTDYEYMMWLDSDIEFEPEHVSAIWNMDADVGVGVYAMKKQGEDWYAAWHNGKLVKDLEQFDGPIKVDYAGTGFMLIKRSVIESLAERAPIYRSRDDRTVSELYITGEHDNYYESEDYHFCRKAREAGFDIMMDPSVKLKHWGQFAYGGTG
jgi:hypothetical protein